jgi:hypothetical protein
VPSVAMPASLMSIRCPGATDMPLSRAGRLRHRPEV